MAKGERKEALMRIVVLIVSGIIVYVWGYLAFILIIVNWIYSLIAGKRLREVAEFVEYWNTQNYALFTYISGVTNKRPFPFNSLYRLGKFQK